MKIQGKLYDTMKTAMKAVVDHIVTANRWDGPAQIKVAYDNANLTEGRMVWDLWNQATHSLMYDDDHPAFQQGLWTRLMPYQPGFNIYKMQPGIHDAHILTALRKIAKELGVL